MAKLRLSFAHVKRRSIPFHFVSCRSPDWLCSHWSLGVILLIVGAIVILKCLASFAPGKHFWLSGVTATI